VLGSAILYTGNVEDIAVTEDGSGLHVAARTAGIIHLDPTGKVIDRDVGEAVLPIRSLACTADGTILLGRTALGNKYQVGVLDARGYAMLTETDNDILSLVRPSRDGSQVLYMSRAFSPEVFHLPLP